MDDFLGLVLGWFLICFIWAIIQTLWERFIGTTKKSDGFSRNPRSNQSNNIRKRTEEDSSYEVLSLFSEEERRKLNEAEQRKNSTPEARIVYPDRFERITKKFKLVGISFEGRRAYILRNADAIMRAGTLSRSHGLSHDPNAISIDHNGFCCGFMGKDFARVVAPVIDRYPGQIYPEISIWTGYDRCSVSFTLHASTQAAEQALTEALDRCGEY